LSEIQEDFKRKCSVTSLKKEIVATQKFEGSTPPSKNLISKALKRKAFFTNGTLKRERKV